MLIKYIGISFITGAISHGFFSGTRSFLTAGFGIVCFVIGTLLEEDTSTWKTILASTVLAVGIGSVTGGFQHFPDSPERSLIIIPIGYVVSVFFFASINKYILAKKEYTYIAISSVITLLLTLVIFFFIENTGITGHSHATEEHQTSMESISHHSEPSHIPLSSEGKPESPEDAMMREHCKMMPNMPGCEKFKSTQVAGETSGKTLNDRILTEDSTVTDVKPTEIISLKDGTTQDLTIQKVRKVINGTSHIMLSYNGSIPGPTFRVPKGATVKFRVKNTVKELATTIHPHGVRLNYLYDGVPKEHGGVQDPIKMGDIYEQIITFPDTGVMWYHPHTRDDFEQELGEYGVFQVYDPEERTVTDSESVITLDDILIENNTISPFEQDSVNHALMGRYGNTPFVNGNTNFSLTMKQGEVKRLYLVNTANARPFDFRISGVRMKLVGGDIGYREKEKFIDHLIISPAERYMVDIFPEKSGSFLIESIGGGKNISLGALTVLPSEKISPHKQVFDDLKVRNILGELQGKIPSYQAKAPDKSLTITMSMEGMSGMSGMSGGSMMGHSHSGHGEGMSSMNMSMNMSSVGSDGIEWEDTMSTMNANSTNKNTKWILRDNETGKEGMDIKWSFKKGDLVKIRLTNDPRAMHPMQHPFHMHGQRFLVLNSNGVANTEFVWKDTVLIPKDQYVDILVDMSNVGNWMAHCHIVEHLFAGMMLGYRVEG